MFVHNVLEKSAPPADTLVHMHDHAFAAAVRARRRALRLRQDQLAELAQCSTRFVHMVEAGKTTLRLDKLLTLLDALGLGLELQRRPGLRVADDLTPPAS
jgi:y4mF family transcriptional regulator